MYETSRTFGQWSLPGTPNAISSPESADGNLPSCEQAGPMIAPCGLGHAHANLSARQAKEQGLLTSGTYGQATFGSSGSVALTQSLANRLAARLDLHGSTLFRLTWKQRATASGRLIYALRASARSTSGKGYTSWPTPTGPAPHDSENTVGRARPRKGYGTDLPIAAALANWPTPQTRDYRSGDKPGSPRWERKVEEGWGFNLNDLAPLASPRATPAARDWKSGQASQETLEKNSRPLNEQVVASWSTPAAAHATGNHGGGQNCDLRPQVADFGQTPNGSSAAMEKPGQLNPAFSLWLMGYPTEWAHCAARVTR